MHMCTTIYTIHTQKYKTHATTLPLSSSKSSRRKLSLKETTNALSKQFNSNNSKRQKTMVHTWSHKKETHIRN